MFGWQVQALVGVLGLVLACDSTEKGGRASDSGEAGTTGAGGSSGVAPRDVYEASADMVGIYRIELRSGDAQGCGDAPMPPTDVTHFWLDRHNAPDFVETCGCQGVEGCRELRSRDLVPCVEQRLLLDYVNAQRFETHAPLSGTRQADVCKEAGYTVQTLERLSERKLLLDATFHLADVPATDGECLRDESRVGSPEFPCTQRTVFSAVWEAPLEP